MARDVSHAHLSSLGGRHVELGAAGEPYRGRGRGGSRRLSGELSSTSQPPGSEYSTGTAAVDVHGQETKQNHEEYINIYIYTYNKEWNG
jgi:hypothetical protein